MAFVKRIACATALGVAMLTGYGLSAHRRRRDRLDLWPTAPSLEMQELENLR